MCLQGKDTDTDVILKHLLIFAVLHIFRSKVWIITVHENTSFFKPFDVFSSYIFLERNSPILGFTYTCKCSIYALSSIGLKRLSPLQSYRTFPPLLTQFFVSPLSRLAVAHSTPLILSPHLPLTDLSLITWDPAPQAQPHVVMETAPHASVGLNDMA